MSNPHSSPAKKKKGERPEQPRTPVRDADTALHAFSPGFMTNSALFMSPAALFEGPNKIPSSRDWTKFDHGADSISENIFAQDLMFASPLGNRQSKRQGADDLSPLLTELCESDPCFDSASQNLLHANKAHLTNRTRSAVPGAPFNLIGEGNRSSQSLFLDEDHPSDSLLLVNSIDSNPSSSSSLLYHSASSSRTQPPRTSSVQSAIPKPQRFHQPIDLQLRDNVPAVMGGVYSLADTVTPVKSSRDALRHLDLLSPASEMSGLDAIITAAGDDLQQTPESVVQPQSLVDIDNMGGPAIHALSAQKQPILLSTQDSHPNPGDSSRLKLEIQANLLRSQSQAANRGDEKAVNCNCKKSKCLKMYCDCFRLTEYCKTGCHCIDCNNLEQYEHVRQSAIKGITERNPEAFKPRVSEDPKSQSKGHLTGCHCRKSQCLKKYCECFTGHVPCSSRCRCADCKNGPELYANVLPATGSHTDSVRKPSSNSISAIHSNVVDGNGSGLAMQSPAYKSMRTPDLLALSSKYSQSAYRDDLVPPSQPSSAMSKSSGLPMRRRDEISDESTDSPERLRLDDTILSPESDNRILSTIRNDVHVTESIDLSRATTTNSSSSSSSSSSSNAGELIPPSSPLRSVGSPQAVHSPVRLLELANLCEERQGQESSSQSHSQAASRSGSITS